MRYRSPYGMRSGATKCLSLFSCTNTVQSHSMKLYFIFLNANIYKTVLDLYKINRQLIWFSSILIGRKTRVNMLLLNKSIPLVFSCDQFTVENGNVSVTSLEYGGSATVQCHPGYWADNSLESMTVTCEPTKTWTLIPTCLSITSKLTLYFRLKLYRGVSNLLFRHCLNQSIVNNVVHILIIWRWVI